MLLVVGGASAYGQHHVLVKTRTLSDLGMRGKAVFTVSFLGRGQGDDLMLLSGQRSGRPASLISHLYNLSLCMLYGLPGFIQQAGLHALINAKRESATMRDIYRRRRDLLVDALNSIELLDFKIPEAAMYLMVDVRKTGLSAGEFANVLFDETGVSTLDATAFGKCAEGFIRISFTLSDSQLRDACGRIKLFMSRFETGSSSARCRDSLSRP